jgi:hypothetical protein
VRSRQLEKVLEKIEDLRTQRGIEGEGAEAVEQGESELPFLEESEPKE